jgi:hypothetical protein
MGAAANLDCSDLFHNRSWPVPPKRGGLVVMFYDRIFRTTWSLCTHRHYCFVDDHLVGHKNNQNDKMVMPKTRLLKEKQFLTTGGIYFTAQ